MHFEVDELNAPYLHVQCGDIAHLVEHPAEWRIAYNARIENIYRSMLMVLPEKCEAILDIGGGLSGIGARLCAHYDGKPHVAVLDGKNALAVVNKHREPFNSATRTLSFLRQHGVKDRGFYAPGDEIDRKFDLVISTQAWGFHFAPHVYLPRVVRALNSRGTVIVDLRKSHPEWRDDLRTAFGEETLLANAEKWERLAFKVSQQPTEV